MGIDEAVEAARLTAERFDTTEFLERTDRDELRDAFRQVVDALVQSAERLQKAPMDCFETFTDHLKEFMRLLNAVELSACGQVAMLMLQGPFLRQLRSSLGLASDILEGLQDVINAGTARGNDSDGEGASDARLRSAGARLTSVRLEALEQGATWQDALRAAVEPEDAAGQPEAAAAAAVRGVLVQAGLPESALEDEQVCTELVTELFELTGVITNSPRQPVGGALLSTEDRALISAVAAALMSGPAPPPSTEQDGGSGSASRADGGAAGDAGTSTNRAHTVLLSTPQQRKMRRKLPRSLLCPITQVLMRDPVSTETGHTYERSAIEQWLRDKNHDPITRKALQSKTLTPAWAVKGAIEEWLREAGMSYEEYVSMEDQDSDEEPEEQGQDTGPAVGGLQQPSTPALSEPPPAASTASPAGAPAASAAGGSACPQRPPRLMDYVTASPEYRQFADAADGPLAPGKYGLVVMDDRTDSKPLRVLSLQQPRTLWWYHRPALQLVPASDLPPELIPDLSYSPDDLSAPVTPLTSGPSMLVRRGYGWEAPPGISEAAEQQLREEVGVLASSHTVGRSWTVYWQGGTEEVLRTGEDNKFELQHFQVNRLAGAPVVDDAALVQGCAVVRGLFWTWAETQDGGPGTVGSLEKDERPGWVAARWPNRCVARYRARSTQQMGFDLNYCARPGEAVTVFNARRGLKVVRGPNWKWDSQDSGGGVGRLLRPSTWADGSGAWWQVQWADGARNLYRVGKPGSGWCDLQVALYGSEAGSSLDPGTDVVLAPEYERYADAKDGPMKPGDVGVVVGGAGGNRFEVMHVGTFRRFSYDRSALRPLPGKLAVGRCQAMRLNRDGRAAFLGSAADGTSGGDTGKLPSEVYYCGARLFQCRCGGCNGQCGPTNGCPCHACLDLITTTSA